MRAAALVMPSSTDEIAGILKHCNQAGQAVLTQGGLTNCVSGVESSDNDVVLSTEKMNSVIDIDKVGGTAAVRSYHPM